MIFRQATGAKKSTGGFRPTLVTDDHDEETERLTGRAPSVSARNIGAWQPE